MLSNPFLSSFIHCYQPSDVQPAHQFHLDPSQTTDRAKFKLVPTATQPTTPACILSSRITLVFYSTDCNHAEWGRMVFSNESRFQLYPDDVSEDTQGTIACLIGPLPGVMVWDAVTFYGRTSLVVIRGNL
ncbi:hypothetical protein TNCV_1281951 [Trichonephila clavipes]|uniref:Uncharacterized protein n=1 Tax=Trichonephila clavipes TaxID=2585209 RepID=A0A8X6VEJ4_TRICX|nr:hypothetical protein TNCV_1281951 [Trichonephila clavipes]